MMVSESSMFKRSKIVPVPKIAAHFGELRAYFDVARVMCPVKAFRAHPLVFTYIPSSHTQHRSRHTILVAHIVGAVRIDKTGTRHHLVNTS